MKKVTPALLREKVKIDIYFVHFLKKHLQLEAAHIKKN